MSRDLVKKGRYSYVWYRGDKKRIPAESSANFGFKFDRPKVGVAPRAAQIRNPQAIPVHIDTGYQS